MSYYGNNPPYYISAYGMARKMGFEGTVEEWLDSLTAFYMAKKAGFTGTSEEWVRKLVDPLPDITIGQVTTLEGGSMATVEITGSKEKPVLNFGIPRGVGMADALTLVGGTMKGVINMDNFGITNLPAPVNTGDAVRKDYADKIREDVTQAATEAKNAAITAKNTADGAVSAAGSAARAAEAAQKTADSKATKMLFTVALTAANWTGDAAPYTQTVAVAGILAEDEPHWDVELTRDAAGKLALLEGYGCVSELETETDSVTFTCLEEKPAVDLTIRMEVIR